MVADISKTSVCPLAKVMRRELKKRGINHVKVVFSKEIAQAASAHLEHQLQQREEAHTARAQELERQLATVTAQLEGSQGRKRGTR